MMTNLPLETQRVPDWLEKEAGDREGKNDSCPIDEYDLVSAPNDFNPRTLVTLSIPALSLFLDFSATMSGISNMPPI